jgi:hypothetical protein
MLPVAAAYGQVGIVEPAPTLVVVNIIETAAIISAARVLVRGGYPYYARTLTHIERRSCRRSRRRRRPQ